MDAVFALLGGLAGSAVFAHFHETLIPLLYGPTNVGQITLADWVGGKPLAAAFERAGGFPQLLLGAIRNGESTGTLDEAFKRLGDYYNGEVKRTMQLLVNALEPISILALGGIFGLILLSILLPLYDVIGEFGKAY